MAKKSSMGRQKIKIAKIEIKNHLQVTFSKRRSGLIKKASELCTLCGVEIAVIVFSPAGKVFPFGHPNVETIIDRFINRTPPTKNGAFRLIEAHRNASLHELNLQLTQILNELEVEKKRGETFDLMRKASQNHYWWQAPTTKLGLLELEQLKDSMENLKKKVTNHANDLMAQATNSSSCLAINGGSGLFDHYESKPTRPFVTSAASDVYNFGYDHGVF